MARLLAAGAAVVVVAFGAAFGISRALSSGGTAHAAKPAIHATVQEAAPAPDPALAASFSGQPASLVRISPSSPRRHPRKATKHRSSTAGSSSSPSTASSSPATTSSASSSSSTKATVPSVPLGGTGGSGSSGAKPTTHRSSHHRSGSGSGTITIP